MNQNPNNHLERELNVNPIISILTNNEQYLLKARDKLIELFGAIDCISQKYQFDKTDYYESEMGKDLFRVLFCFTNLIRPDEIVKIKLAALKLESLFSTNDKRIVNIDPGYMDMGKIVLVSVKYGTQKIYLGSGVWADILLLYENGRYIPLPWSFPDFKSGIYNDFFQKYRDIYKSKVKNI